MLLNRRCPSPRSRPIGRVLLAAALLLGACTGGDGSGAGADLAEGDDVQGEIGPLPTIAGGVALSAVDPAAVLVGDGLAFGVPLPSEQGAADAFTESPEVASAIARRVLDVGTAQVIAEVVVLLLDGLEIFDEGVLDGFVRGVVEASGGAPIEERLVGDRLTFRSSGPTLGAHGFLDGNLLVLVTAPTVDTATSVVERQLAARAAGIVGSPTPLTPMLPLPIDAVFVAVPTVSFQPIPPPEEEADPPVPPLLPGATGLQGRYGVVAGERRTVVWAFTVDPAAYPSAEALEPAMGALVFGRAGGSGSGLLEVLDRVVLSADAAPGVDGALSARSFRHGALVVLVEGREPAQLDAVVTDWITTLAGG